MKLGHPFEGYGGHDEMPLGGYAVLAVTYGVAFGAALTALSRRRALPRFFRTRDLMLAGVATHKLTRTITRDWVTAPIRAAFTEYAGSRGHGEVREKSRGSGLRRAIGDLASCPYCTGPWVAGALLCGFAAWPRVTRALAGIFAVVTVSDFLHETYDVVAERRTLTVSEGSNREVRQ